MLLNVHILSFQRLKSSRRKLNQLLYRKVGIFATFSCIADFDIIIIIYQMCKYYLKEPDAVKEKAPEPKPKRGEFFPLRSFCIHPFLWRFN